jgi:hypothetical protein
MKVIDLGNGVECITDGAGYNGWILNGKSHRVDGAYGDKHWFLNDIQYSEEEFEDVIWKQ